VVFGAGSRLAKEFAGSRLAVLFGSSLLAAELALLRQSSPGQELPSKTPRAYQIPSVTGALNTNITY
jgi:hypothetical protein